MAIVNTDSIISGVVTSVRAIVGSRLSILTNTASGSQTQAAVIKDVQSGIRPDYPYILITLDSNNKQSGAWQRHVTVSTVTNKPVYVSEQDVKIRITCYGDGATDILNELRIKVLDPWNRSIIESDTGSTFREITEIQRQPVYLSTDFVNTAYTLICLTAVSTYEPTDGEPIERVTGTGDILDYENDPNPITIVFDEPS